jgi:hypothetical protein
MIDEQKTKDLATGYERWCLGKVISFCSSSGTPRTIPVKYLVICEGRRM